MQFLFLFLMSSASFAANECYYFFRSSEAEEQKVFKEYLKSTQQRLKNKVAAAYQKEGFTVPADKIEFSLRLGSQGDKLFATPVRVEYQNNKFDVWPVTLSFLDYSGLFDNCKNTDNSLVENCLVVRRLKTENKSYDRLGHYLGVQCSTNYGPTPSKEHFASIHVWDPKKRVIIVKDRFSSVGASRFFGE